MILILEIYFKISRKMSVPLPVRQITYVNVLANIEISYQRLLRWVNYVYSYQINTGLVEKVL